MPRTGEHERPARVTTNARMMPRHGGTVFGTRGFILSGDTVSPAGPMALRARDAKVTRMWTAAPMAWTATVMAPRSPYPDGDVTVVVRVTYNTLEAIIRDEFMLTESRVAH
jgi:hypothetical protein